MDCDSPCFAGIRPGETYVGDARAALAAHAWVGTVTDAPYTDFTVGYMQWTWSGAQPDIIDSSRPGLMGYQHGVIRQIELPTRLTFGDVWLSLGAAPNGALFEDAGVRPHLLHIAAYQRGTQRFVTYLPCPVRERRYWTAWVNFSWVHADAVTPTTLRPYQRPQWGGCP
jgi:hypothetical protein